MVNKKISDAELLQEFEAGKSLKEIAKDHGYGKCGKDNLAIRLRKLKDYKGRKRIKLKKVGKSNTRLISIPSTLLKDAGLNPEKELIAVREAGANTIILKIFENE